MQEREERVQEAEAVDDSMESVSGQNGTDDPMNTQSLHTRVSSVPIQARPYPSVEREAGQAGHSLLAKEQLAINFF